MSLLNRSCYFKMNPSVLVYPQCFFSVLTKEPQFSLHVRTNVSLCFQLEEVMETETYKNAKLILERFDPEAKKKAVSLIYLFFFCIYMCSFIFVLFDFCWFCLLLCCRSWSRLRCVLRWLPGQDKVQHTSTHNREIKHHLFEFVEWCLMELRPELCRDKREYND